MTAALERRIAALEGARGLGAICIKVIPMAVAADPDRWAAFRAEAERNAPSGSRIVLVHTGVPRDQDVAL